MQPGKAISLTTWRLARSTTVTLEAGVKLKTSANAPFRVTCSAAFCGTTCMRLAPGNSTSPRSCRLPAS